MMGRLAKIDRRAYVLPVLLLAFGLRVYRLENQSFWWDEMHAAAMSILPLDAVLDNLLAIRNHVPLYFFLIRFWSLVGHGEFVLRYLSVAWGMVGIALVYRIGTFLGDLEVGWSAALLLALSPFHIWYSQEARMYTMVSTCALMGNWFLLRLLHRDRWGDWIGYGLSMLAAVYTHYLAVFVVLAHYVFLSLHYRILRRVFVRWLVCSGAVLMLFGIWASIIMLSGGFAGSPIGWIKPAHWYEPVFTFLAFSAGTTIDPNSIGGYLSLAVCLAAISLCVIRPTRRRVIAYLSPVPSLDSPVQDRPDALLAIKMLFSWLIVPLLITWAISLDLPIPQKRSIYVDRYLITALPAFVLLAACGLVYASRKRWLASVAWGIVIVVAAQALFRLYFDPAYARDNWRAAVAHLETATTTEDVVLLNPSHTLPLAYYMDEPVPYQEFPFLFYEHEREAFLQHEIEPRMIEIAAQWRRAWLISSVDNTNPHGFPQERNAALLLIRERDAIKAWLDERYPILEERRFTGVWLTLYDLADAANRTG